MTCHGFTPANLHSPFMWQQCNENHSPGQYLLYRIHLYFYENKLNVIYDTLFYYNIGGETFFILHFFIIVFALKTVEHSMVEKDAP